MMLVKSLGKKKLAKTIVCGLLASAGLFAGMETAQAKIVLDGDVMKVYGWANLDYGYPHLYANYLQFYIDDSVKEDKPMLTAINKFELNRFEGISAGVKTGSKLKVGDTVRLLEAINSDLKNFDPGKVEILKESDYKEFGLSFEVEGNFFLNAEVTSLPNKGIRKEAKSLAETQAASLTMLNMGADVLAGQGFDNAASAVADEVKAGGSASSLTPFVVISGNKTKVKSGSHVDVTGKNLNVGFAKELDNRAGKLLIGPFVEYGKGSYDSYLDDSYHSEGNTKYIGGGIMAKQINNSGIYYEGSLRAGKLDNDYKAEVNHYDGDSTYYAAHIGVGKALKLSEKNTLDCYGKYFYTHQKGYNTTLHAGAVDYDMHFDSVKSNRTRLGSRFTHAMNEKNSVYAGLAWQHEFSGTARAALDGAGTPAPSLKGNSGIMELGWKVEAGMKLDLDLGATGYIGKQKGAALNLSVNYKF